MAYTHVTKLETVDAIKDFFDCLVQLKKLAPKSLTYTIAVTVNRETITRELKHGGTQETNEVIKKSINKFERKHSTTF